MEGISFVLRENSPARGDTLALATRQAMIKAESIAQSLNGKIVRVVETTEGGIAARPPVSDYSNASSMSNSMMAAAKRTYTTPVEAGSLDVRSQVLLVVEIEVKR